MVEFFSKVAVEAKASDVRELLKLTKIPGMISFAGGLPSPDAFPVEEMKGVAVDVIDKHGYKAMQYGTTEGLAELRTLIKDIMAKRHVNTDISNILITTGSQQGLDLCGKVFINKGDKIACESPTYLAAISALKPYQPQFVEIDMDEEGMRLDHLEKQLQSEKIKFIYTIPDFQNPSGRSMTIERRRAMVDLANKYDVLIVEDSPYSELAYDQEAYAPIKSFDTEGRVIYLSTFSKIVCPGFRVGWICADEKYLSKYIILKQGLDLHTNQFSQYMIENYYSKYNMDQQIDQIKSLYRTKRDAMIEAIELHFPKSVKTSKPAGGMFLWVELPEGIDSKALLPKALEQKVAYVSGEAFYPNIPKKNTMRLNFSNSTVSEIHKGIKILGEILSEALL
ncbi:aminotransferase-like domain-containing protein [Fusibacter ferrireducens]|uniref:PLP-dependent aminotransferase family protein n=1 Tax=Fusibacter ferrireducens TaxID=2785058 RepID=A0ABR9ZUF1_9FIRM|nr:PLP-dependent aminotransferase family protein [Fusibacter ferrireducens]MBF4694093.1 PLP-dependent aminotransferase family protein [Fusibacter ferrireducens]